MSTVAYQCTGAASDMLMCAALMTVGMPFILPQGTAPNAIASVSKPFAGSAFSEYSCIASVMQAPKRTPRC